MRTVVRPLVFLRGECAASSLDSSSGKSHPVKWRLPEAYDTLNIAAFIPFGKIGTYGTPHFPVNSRKEGLHNRQDYDPGEK
jgi:hypothetical protein